MLTACRSKRASTVRRPSMAFLIKERGINAGEVIELVTPRCLLGRAADCDVRDAFDGNERVSRRCAI